MLRGEGRVVSQRKPKVLRTGTGGWVLGRQEADVHVEGTFAAARMARRRKWGRARRIKP